MTKQRKERAMNSSLNATRNKFVTSLDVLFFLFIFAAPEIKTDTLH
jgi:hypothetical protein